MQGIPFSVTQDISAVGNAEVKAAGGSGKRHFVTSGVITIEAHADTGLISLDDGTADIIGPILCKDGNGSVFLINFGETGYDWGSNKAIRLINSTANVSARITLVGYTTG